MHAPRSDLIVTCKDCGDTMMFDSLSHAENGLDVLVQFICRCGAVRQHEAKGKKLIVSTVQTFGEKTFHTPDVESFKKIKSASDVKYVQ